jgi:hypothetical protein
MPLSSKLARFLPRTIHWYASPLQAVTSCTPTRALCWAWLSAHSSSPSCSRTQPSGTARSSNVPAAFQADAPLSVCFSWRARSAASCSDSCLGSGGGASLAARAAHAL